MITSRQAANGVREQLRPSQIAKNSGCSVEEVIYAIALAVLEGHIKRTDVLLCFGRDQRCVLESIAQYTDLPWEQAWSIVGPGSDLDEAEVHLMWDILSRSAVESDVFDLVLGIEKYLHYQIRDRLKGKFGDSEAQWWAKGVPLATCRA